MADEQIIYLSPEEELTTVRERLEQTNAKRIILVIPPQTKLRSLVAWRLLHSRTRELSKEVLIVSSDRQIRSVVKAAGFRVADSLESPSSGKSRAAPPSRSGRTGGMGGRNLSRTRGASARSGPENRMVRQREQSPRQTFATDVREAPQQQQIQPEKTSRVDEIAAANSTHPASSTFEAGSKSYSQNYDYHIETAPPIRPLPSKQEDEEPDLLIEDYNQAQIIRHAYEQGEAVANLPAEDLPRSRSTSPAPTKIDEDPFSYKEEIQPISLPEQRGSVSFDEIDTGAPDISDIPTDVLAEGEIEDLGDEGDFVLPEYRSPDSWSRSAMEEPKRSGASRLHKMPVSNNRTGNRPASSNLSASYPSASMQDIEDEDTLMPPPAEVPRIQPAPSIRPSGSLNTRNREPQPIPPTPSSSARSSGSLNTRRASQPMRQQPPKIFSARSASPEISNRMKKPAPGERTVTSPSASPEISNRMKKPAPGGRTVTPPSAMPARMASRAAPKVAGKPAAARSSGRGTFVALMISLLILLLIAGLAYFVPDADVTIAIPSQSFSTLVKLTATATSKQDVKNHTVSAQTLVYNKSASETANATGSKAVGNAVASGNVTFTNNGSAAITIPTGTTLSTADGTQFVTMAEALVLTANSNIGNTILTPIQAKTSGSNGNVAANTITVIPTDSISAIEQDPANTGITINSSTLKVTNPSATSGGGATNEKAVSSSDVTNLTASLDKSLQQSAIQWLRSQGAQDKLAQTQFNAWIDWLQKQKLTSMQAATVTPNVGQLAPHGTFNETLKLHLTVLIVPVPALETAAKAELNAAVAATKQDAGEALLSQEPVSLGIISSTPSSDGKSVKLSFNASGQIGQQISEGQVSNSLAGQSVNGARNAIANGAAGIRGVQSNNIRIQVQPSFFPWMPFRPENIHLIIRAARATTVPKK